MPGQGESDLDLALEAWRAEHGASWELDVDPKIGFGELLYGGGAAPLTRPEDDAGFVEAAARFVQMSQSLHGIDASTLVFDRVAFLPLSLIGSSDKTTVKLAQQVHGVPVEGGYVNILMDTVEGTLLSIQNTGLPGLESFDTESAISAEAAIILAAEQLHVDTGLLVEEIRLPVLVIVQIEDETTRTPLLTWRVRASTSQEETEPEPVRMTYFFDAKSGALVRSADGIAHYDVSGTVHSKVTAGTQALHQDSDEEPKPMSGLRIYDVTGSQILGTTNEDGTFTIPGAAPLNIKLRYEGSALPRILNEDHNLPTEYEQEFQLQSGTGNVVTMNDTPVLLTTAQANAYYWIIRMRDWILDINPTDDIWDEFAADKPLVKVNVGGFCNATAATPDDVLTIGTSSSCLPYCLGEGCTNKANATIIAHELGHLLNHKYMGDYNPEERWAFDEGNADVWALYLTDQSTMGADYCLGEPLCGTRRGDNARRSCPIVGCYEGCAHCEGQTLMGAFWKMRLRMKNSQGANGGFVADVLHNAWMNAFNVFSISANIRTQLLILDDCVNAGPPCGVGWINGTPHWADIDLGFAEQGFPRHSSIQNGIVFSSVTGPDPDDVVGETGPYTVTANIVANFASPIQNAKLYYRVNGVGSFTEVTMTNTIGSNYSGSIPSQESPSIVEYYLSATDSISGMYQVGQTAEYPVSISVAMDATVDQYGDVIEDNYDAEEAQPIYRRFYVGDKVTHLAEDFETIPPAGWTHGGLEDDWEFGTPLGKGVDHIWKDPAAAHGGQYCSGNDLGTAAGNDGEYEVNANNWLRTPVIDLSGLSLGDRTFLRFWRWLSVDEWSDTSSFRDVAEIQVIPNGVSSTVWKNHRSIRHIDSSSTTGTWKLFETEITGAIAGASTAQIEWDLRADDDVNRYGGWTIDDVEVFTIKSIP